MVVGIHWEMRWVRFACKLAAVQHLILKLKSALHLIPGQLWGGTGLVARVGTARGSPSKKQKSLPGWQAFLFLS